LGGFSYDVESSKASVEKTHPILILQKRNLSQPSLPSAYDPMLILFTHATNPLYWITKPLIELHVQQKVLSFPYCSNFNPNHDDFFHIDWKEAFKKPTKSADWNSSQMQKG
jgi:hypothetical protein